MTIQPGDRFPDMKVMLATPSGPQEVGTADLFGGSKSVLFAVPGAFTPTCSEQHLPSYITLADQLHAKGIERVVCLAVNDVFVMGAWARQSGAEGRIDMLADGSGVLTRALGMELDLVARGLGVRAQRFAMVIDHSVVTDLAIEPPGGYGVSSAEHILKLLG
ncbi:MAG: peroxiredoxin [Acidocella sp.]|nr:peroxiredoxin [Acidocella sp.]